MNTFEFEFYSNTNTDYVQNVAPAPWPSSPWATGDCPSTSMPQSTLPDLMSTSGCLSTARRYVPDFNATEYEGFALAPTTETVMFTNLPTTQVDYTNQNAPDPWMLAPPLFEVSSAISPLPPVGESYWAGTAPLAAYSAAVTPDLSVSPISTTPTSPGQNEWAWNPNILQLSSMTPALSSGHGGEAGCVALVPSANLSAVMTSQAGWGTSEIYQPTPAAPGHVVASVIATLAPTVALGKRHRETEEPQGGGCVMGIHTHEIPPKKRARGGRTTKGILKAARSTARTHHELGTRTSRTLVERKPKAAGRGAERLAVPSAQGIYLQPLPGPSFQQGVVVDAADGKPTWAKGSVDEGAAHYIDNTVKQQHEEVTSKLFKIPLTFEPGHRLLLQASDADFACGAVLEIKCRLCPNVKFKNFQNFMRHCDFAEVHPIKLKNDDFCERCGDFFARSDSLKRHGKKRSKCRGGTPEMVAQRRRATEEVHEVFIRGLEDCLKTGRGIEKPFSRIIKDKYPGSSKKNRTGNGNERSRR